jgi:cytoskeletal protein CcmA (bactofilin family)
LEIKTPQDTLTIDPIAMNIVNRVAAGAQLNGTLQFEGGLLVQGEISGDITVNGRLIIWAGGVVRGRIKVMGDFYLFGQLGAPAASAEDTILKCVGMAYVANTGVATGTLLASKLTLYDGADLQGPFRTLKPADNVPILRQVRASPVTAAVRPGRSRQVP